MHILHKILVHLPSDVPLEKGQSREDYLERIRRYAEEETDEFYEIAYDWRETSSAGRWCRVYPENVILGSENDKRFIKELLEVQESQRQEVKYCMDTLIECLGNQLTDIVSEIQKHAGQLIGEHHCAFLLEKMAKLLDGKYFYESCFYNASEYTALLDETTIKKIREKPEDWALVFFDYHF